MNAIQKFAAPAGRILLALMFVSAGFSKIGGYAGMQAFMESAGVPGALLVITSYSIHYTKLYDYDLISILSNPSQYANGMLSLTWSVSVEEQFYLVWPIMFLLMGFKRA